MIRLVSIIVAVAAAAVAAARRDGSGNAAFVAILAVLFAVYGPAIVAGA